jgi:hypothetical protein
MQARAVSIIPPVRASLTPPDKTAGSTSGRQLENLVETISWTLAGHTSAPSIITAITEIEAISLSHFSKPREQKPHVGSIKP